MAQEKNFENRIKTWLDEKGCYFVKQFGCAFTKSGVPDLLCCVNGKFVAIEVKAENGKTSDLQDYNIAKIKKAGGIALVVKPSQFDELKDLIERLMNENS